MTGLVVILILCAALAVAAALVADARDDADAGWARAIELEHRLAALTSASDEEEAHR